MKYEMTILTDKPEEVKALVNAIVAIQVGAAETKTIVKCHTTDEPIVKALQAVMPGKVIITKMIEALAATSIMTATPASGVIRFREPCEAVLVDPTKKADGLEVEDPKEIECPGCGEMFVPAHPRAYRCRECSQSAKGQIRDCWTAVIDGKECLFSKVLLNKRLDEGVFQPGIRFTKGDKALLVVKENGNYSLVKA